MTDTPEQEPETVDVEILEAAADSFGETHGHPVEEADEFKPPAGELVVAGNRDVYVVMDRADEMQILDELQGRPIKEMVYDFTSSGSRKTDLSYGGVREVVRTLNRGRYTAIQIDGSRKPEWEELRENDETYVSCTVFAYDAATGMGQWGTAIEPKHMKKKNGDVEWDKFARTKALNKAQRNAMKALLPLEFVETIKARFLGDHKKVAQITAGAGAEDLAELPPPDESPEMKALQQQAREKYKELKLAGGIMLLLPAKFNEYMTKTAHDQDRVRDFLDHLDQLMQEAQAAA